MRPKIFLAAMWAGLLVVSVTLGEELEDRVRHEKINAVSATTLGAGNSEFSAQATYRRSAGGQRGWFNDDYSRDWRWGTVRTYVYELSYAYGIQQNTDISVSGGYADIYDRGVARYGEEHGRGLDDVTVSLKHRFYEEGGTSVAYLPGLTLPVGRHSSRSRGRLGPGQNFWSFNQKLAVTHDAGAVSLNADFGYDLPFGRTREFYSMETMRPEHNVRGIVDANLGIGYQFKSPNIQPVLELGYRREIISRAADAELFPLSIGAIWSTDEGYRVKIAYEHPLTGSNATRARAVTLGFTLPF